MKDYHTIIQLEVKPIGGKWSAKATLAGEEDWSMAGICHDQNSPGQAMTKATFQLFGRMSSCLVCGKHEEEMDGGNSLVGSNQGLCKNCYNEGLQKLLRTIKPVQN